MIQPTYIATNPNFINTATITTGTTNLIIWPPHGRLGADTRTVHAELPDSLQVVRYDRAGKWFLESSLAGRTKVPFRMAVAVAKIIEEVGGQIHLGLMGGKRFDSAVMAECR